MAREKTMPAKTLVHEVASKEPGVRVFVVHSDERAAYESRQRTKAMDRVRVQLEKLEQRVANGRLKVPEKIGAAAARILARNHGHRYYGWAYEDGVFYVAALALLIHRAIDKKLKAARLDLSATEALTALKSVRVVDIDKVDRLDPTGMS